MPRQRKVVMEKIPAKDLHDNAIARTIKLRSPFAVVDADLAGIFDEEAEYAVVYTAPLGGDRKVYATRNVHSNALRLRDMLNEAWAEGHWSSGRTEQ